MLLKDSGHVKHLRSINTKNRVRTSCNSTPCAGRLLVQHTQLANPAVLGSDVRRLRQKIFPVNKQNIQVKIFSFSRNRKARPQKIKNSLPPKPPCFILRIIRSIRVTS